MLTAARDAAPRGDTAYLRGVTHQILWCRPPLVDAVRELAVPANVAGHRLAAGTLIMSSIPLSHRHTASGHSRSLAFGGGVRRCLGAELAMLEMTTVLTSILTAAELVPSAKPDEPARLLGTALHPAHGARITISRATASFSGENRRRRRDALGRIGRT